MVSGHWRITRCYCPVANVVVVVVVVNVVEIGIYNVVVVDSVIKGVVGHFPY